MGIFRKLLRFFTVAVLVVVVLSGLAALGVYYYFTPKLPSIETLKDVQLQVPLRIFSEDGVLIAEFGEKHRTPLNYEQIPERLVQAVLSAEDDRFFQHPGVDYQGLLRAALQLILTGERRQGGSTITMQVARNFFLSREKTYQRKISEILLALKIEKTLEKEEILALYFNKIFLGHRAYGMGAAAQVYYGKDINELDLAQLAVLAGLPKAPSRNNPISNPKAAMVRRAYVLSRMHKLGYITKNEYEQAKIAPITAQKQFSLADLQAPYLAEMVRQEMLDRYGEQAYTNGYQVTTTLKSELQTAGRAALRTALIEYDQRHGFRGPEQNVELFEYPNATDKQKFLSTIPVLGDLQPALVTDIKDNFATVYSQNQLIKLPLSSMRWARRYKTVNSRGPEPKSVLDVIQRGDVVRIHKDSQQNWALAQVPAIEGALVSIRSTDGAIQTLVGGFDFVRSKFNRVNQAQRQPGSAFKPFIYLAALEKGFHPASMVLDTPVVFKDAYLEDTWRPENYSGKFYGPTRLREALVNSRNLVSIRLLREIGTSYAIDVAKRIGLPYRKLPNNLSLALGSGDLTPLELASGYCVLANGGYRVAPYFIQSIEDSNGNQIFHAQPTQVCQDCTERTATASPTTLGQFGEAKDQTDAQLDPKIAQQVIDPRDIFLLNSMLRDVIQRGTGRRAKSLNRADIAGKTGTTNDQRDAWFSGFHPDLVTTAWVGFDQHEKLGNRETGFTHVDSDYGSSAARTSCQDCHATTRYCNRAH